MSVHRLVVVTGLSGSGKSLAANCFEDLGYFCVDNLPVQLIVPFCELIQRGREQIPLAALVVDARERRFLEQVPKILERLGDIPFEVLFFDCSDDVLKRRFSESRRPHPMTAAGGTLEQAIDAEREVLQPLRDVASRIIDTSRLTAHQLRSFLTKAYGSLADTATPSVNVESFGFKYGIPAQVDLLFDVRFLPNPYFVEELRHLNGRDDAVVKFLNESELTGQFFQRLQDFVDYLIPLYRAEGKAYLTIGIGCTGGKHRSVALAERMGRHLQEQGLPHSVSHRDLGKE